MAAPSYWRKSLRRCVGRSNNNANANGGLVYANTNNGSANSNTNNGVRLAIRPKKVIEAIVAIEAIETIVAIEAIEAIETIEDIGTVANRYFIIIVSTEYRHGLADICGRRDRATATAMVTHHRKAGTSKGGSLMKGE
jgi:hypothetical protein